MLGSEATLEDHQVMEKVRLQTAFALYRLNSSMNDASIASSLESNFFYFITTFIA